MDKSIYQYQIVNPYFDRINSGGMITGSGF